MLNRHRFRGLILLAALLPLAACSQSAGQPAQEAETAGNRQAADHAARRPANGQNTDRHGGHEASGDGNHAEDDAQGHDEHERVVHLSAAQRQRLDLDVATAEAGSATATVQAPATVAFDADRVARVGPRLEAKVLEVTRDLGDAVEKGDTVAILDSVELGRAKARYLTTAARLESGLAEYRRDRKLAEQKITSESEVLNSKAAYLQAKAERDAARAELRLYGLDSSDIDSILVGGDQPLSRYVLSAPIAGTIQQRDLVPGQTISAQQTPIHVVNSERMWVMIEAYERDLPRLATGQSVTLKIRALPEHTFSGETDWVSAELDAQNRTVRVRAIVPNENGLLRAGMFGEARIQTPGAQHYALVPVDAVQTVAGEQVVFVPGDEEGAFRAAQVLTGDESGGQVEIRSGLQPGDAVVVQGAFDLNSALSAGSRSAEHSH